MTGDVIENPVTGERGVVRLGPVEIAGPRAVVDLYVRPGGADQLGRRITKE